MLWPVLRKTGSGPFSVLAALGSLGAIAAASRPKSPGGDFVKTGALNRSATHPLVPFINLAQAVASPGEGPAI